jgi:hypothetical protein
MFGNYSRLRGGGRDRIPEEEKEYLEKGLVKKNTCIPGHGNLINDEMVTWYNSSQTCPCALQTVAQPDFLRIKIQTCLKNVKLLHKQPNHPTHDQFAQENARRKLFDRVWGPLDNALFEPTALALRKRGTARNFMHAMGCETRLRGLQSTG